MAVTREQVLALLEPTVEGLGYELAELECRLGRGRGMLRLFIDREEGIALEDCERVSREVAAILDVEDPIPGDYDLEVSSPGLDRKLVKPLHFDRFAGCEVKVRLRQLLDKLGLGHRTKALPAELSGGERTRLAALMALMKKPRVLLADEPTAALDAKNSELMMELLVGAAREDGVTVLVVSHDPMVFEKSNSVFSLVKVN